MSEACSEEDRLIQALRNQLRHMQQELGEVRESVAIAEHQAEEHRAESEALKDLHRCQLQETRRLARQQQQERRHQAALRDQLEELRRERRRRAERAERDRARRRLETLEAEEVQQLQQEVSEAQLQLLDLQGCGRQLREELQELKRQEPRPAWSGDRPATPKRPKEAKELSFSPRSPGDRSFVRQGEAREAQQELAELQASLRREQRRGDQLHSRERTLQQRHRQLEAALKENRMSQAKSLSDVNAELQEGAHHVQRLLGFALQVPCAM
ncbi:unnamed protein product [Effrenium voratum]|uniref:Uncharacterized protein n=1 Tax=Effrenium voratum TaxID=2562239 RepID=A0AA36HK01_9DINO|nr:unnamed protein product [Effrenium voratum]CAJ1460570.1 unnamed protein product [Effrenium voratum]